VLAEHSGLAYDPVEVAATHASQNHVSQAEVQMPLAHCHLRSASAERRGIHHGISGWRW
jgi:hypothetical protein